MHKNLSYIDFTGIKAKNILFDGMSVKDFIYLKYMASVGEVLLDAFGSGYELVRDNEEPIKDEFELMKWDDSDQ